jgi:hypothetical protein
MVGGHSFSLRVRVRWHCAQPPERYYGSGDLHFITCRCYRRHTADGLPRTTLTSAVRKSATDFHGFTRMQRLGRILWNVGRRLDLRLAGRVLVFIENPGVGSVSPHLYKERKGGPATRPLQKAQGAGHPAEQECGWDRTISATLGWGTRQTGAKHRRPPALFAKNANKGGAPNVKFVRRSRRG